MAKNNKLSGTIATISEQEKLFCEEYIIDFNATAAAARAGVAGGHKAQSSAGWRMLRNPLIVSYIRDLLQQRSEHIAVDQFWVIDQLLEVYKRCLDNVGTNSAATAGALKSLEMIGKNIGMFSERHVHEVIANMTDSELLLKTRQIMAKHLLAPEEHH